MHHKEAVDVEKAFRPLKNKSAATRDLDLETLADNIPDVIFRIDKHFRHVYVNKSIQALTGLGPVEFIGKTNRELGMPEDKCLLWETKFAEALTTKKQVEFDFEFPSKIGLRHFHTRLIPETKEDGSIETILGIANDITPYKSTLLALQEREEILHLVHQTAQIGHWEWNSLTDENKWSPEIQALYGLRPGAFEGTYEAWAKLLHPDDLPKAEEDVRKALETGKYFTEFRVIWPDGSVHWLEARADVFRDDHGKAVRIMGVNMDITERKRQEEALREADRRKDLFIATLAHELRNPLAPVRNAVQVLKAKGLTEQNLKGCQDVIERQVGQMARLLDDLLDVSRITRNSMELRKERVSLPSLVESAVETSRPVIIGGGHALTVLLPSEPVYLDADPVRLTQVFGNLLNNAGKYTQRGGDIRFSAERVGNEIVVSVKDNGIGIACSMMPHLFEVFSQSKPALEFSQGGLGIGLSLVKGLVEMHGGSVEARSDGPGKGSEFVVRLPLAVAPLRPEQTRAKVEKPRTPRLKIVVADDNRDSAETLALMLTLLDHDVRTASDGQEAADISEAFRPNVILLDIGMPRLNGYDACRHIRKQPWGSEVLIIALTGWGQEEDRRQSQEAGFNAHLVKPVDPNALEKLLATRGSAKQS